MRETSGEYHEAASCTPRSGGLRRGGRDSTHVTLARGAATASQHESLARRGQSPEGAAVVSRGSQPAKARFILEKIQLLRGEFEEMVHTDSTFKKLL